MSTTAYLTGGFFLMAVGITWLLWSIASVASKPMPPMPESAAVDPHEDPETPIFNAAVRRQAERLSAELNDDEAVSRWLSGGAA